MKAENLRLLERRFPEVYQQVLLIDEQKCPPLLPTPSGAVTVKETTPDGREIFVHSSNDPVSEGERAARSIPSDHSILAFIGCGLFYHILAAVRALPGNEPLILVEREPVIFHAALRAVSLAPLLEREGTVLLLGTPPHEIESFVSGNYALEDLAGLRIVRHLPSFETGADYYKDVERRLTFRRDLADCMVQDRSLSDYLQRFSHPEEITLKQALSELRQSRDKITEAEGILLIMEALGKE